MKYSLFFIIALIATTAFAQDNTATDTIIAQADTTELSIGRSKILIISSDDSYDKTIVKETTKWNDKNRKAMWSGIQLGISTLDFAPFEEITQATPSFLELDGTKNRSFAINPFSIRWDLGTPHVGLSTGLGFAFNRYALNRNVRLQYDADHVWADLDTTNSFTKNFFKTTHLTAPLFLEFNTKRKSENGFRIAIGVEAGYLLTAKTKIKYKEDGRRQIDKTKGNFNLNPFRISPMVLIGYQGLSFYAKASATPLFLENKGPSNIYHASAGLFINFN